MKAVYKIEDSNKSWSYEEVTWPNGADTHDLYLFLPHWLLYLNHICPHGEFHVTKWLSKWSGNFHCWVLNLPKAKTIAKPPTLFLSTISQPPEDGLVTQDHFCPEKTLFCLYMFRLLFLLLFPFLHHLLLSLFLSHPPLLLPLLSHSQEIILYFSLWCHIDLHLKSCTQQSSKTILAKISVNFSNVKFSCHFFFGFVSAIVKSDHILLLETYPFLDSLSVPNTKTRSFSPVSFVGRSSTACFLNWPL